MCGICGFIKFDKKVSNRDEEIVRAMNAKLLHRGPDAQDTFLFRNVALGFSRLSIIGLENGMQPIFNEDESLVLICNGEIFNYVELREQLIKDGHRFRTASDVEVILHLYEDHGTSFLNLLNGQFAFALYDRKAEVLFCARDQLGIIPFFYTFVDQTFVFGSEIKAILEHPAVSAEVDLVGLDQVFTFAGLISPRTMFKNINSLENGHFLLVDRNGEITKGEYWDLDFPMIGDCLPDLSESEFVQRLEAQFEEAVRLRLRADVPSGLYLSGGVDSSIIAMMVNHLEPGLQKEAFSIDFVDSRHSESLYQKLMAEACHANLHQKIFLFDDISRRLQHSVYHSECPIKETYNTASLALSENVRNNGIKVILSGEGADEFFAGYVGYRFDKMRQLNLVNNSATAAERAIRQKIWGDGSFYYERNFLEYDQVKKQLYSKGLSASFEEINCLNHQLVNQDKIKGRDILSKRAYIDYKIRLVDHLVADHGDRMAMANSVEVRYPFLDKNLVEFSTKVPPGLKLKDFTEKYILKKMGKKWVPKAIIDREKFHFIAPGSPYLLQKNVEYINDLLSYDQIKRQGYFDPDQMERYKKKYAEKGFRINAPYENDMLITVITFGILLDQFFQPN